MEQEAKLILTNREKIIENVLVWQKENYPLRTDSYDKCERDLEFVIRAYYNDILSDTVRNIQNVSAMYWFNNRRQIVETETEFATHEFMVQYILQNIVPNNEDFEIRLRQLHEILVETIEIGPKYQSYTHMNRYQYVAEYDESVNVDYHLIEQGLYDAWKHTPSKNNFMPYKVHVISPKDQYTKELIYYKCLENETKANGNHITDLEELKRYEILEYDNNNSKPNYYNVKSAHYILLFTQRVEDQPNHYQQELVNRGFVYEQMAKNGPKKDSARSLSYMEIGMFCSNFANAVLANGLDVSHTCCFPNDRKYWSEPVFNFLDTNPLLIMTAGKAKKYRRDSLPWDYDPKPDFDRIVNLV